MPNAATRPPSAPHVAAGLSCDRNARYLFEETPPAQRSPPGTGRRLKREIIMADGQGFGPSLSAFDWADAFRLSDQLTEDERMVAESARSYAADKLQPRVRAAYREERVEPEIFREMGEMGLLGVTIPEEYGGLGAGYVSYGLVAREIERVDSGYRSMMSVQSSLVMYPIHAYGSRRKNASIFRSLRPESSSAASA
jgi:hypothetical protein